MNATAKMKPSNHFFLRESDGSVRIRIRFTAEEASVYEEAAGETPLLHWIHQTLGDTAREQVRAAREQQPRPKVKP